MLPRRRVPQPVLKMIDCQGLTKQYGLLLAVNDLSFQVRPGEVLGFLGPNGAGKTTTMRIIAGFLPPTSGRASVCGFDVETQATEAKRKIGYLPEGAPTYGDMSPRAFLDFVAEIRGFDGSERERYVDGVVEKVILQSVLDQPIETLSKGFKRRVGLAQAIMHDPEVLILDEPTDGLDPNQKQTTPAQTAWISVFQIIWNCSFVIQPWNTARVRSINSRKKTYVMTGLTDADRLTKNFEALSVISLCSL